MTRRSIPLPALLLAAAAALGHAGHAAAANAPPSAERSLRYAKGILWEVSRPGSAPSHILGTIHVADPRVLALPPAVSAAFASSRSFLTELVLSEAAARRYYEAAQFGDGRTLEGLIGAEDYARVGAIMRARAFPPDLLPRTKPWAVMLNLALPAPSAAEGGVVLDRHLYLLARVQRKAVGELDQLEEQIFLFDEMPMDAQVALLRNALANHHRLGETTERAISAWIARDLGALWNISQEAAVSAPNAAELAPYQALFNRRILFDRNVVMAYRMQPELRRGRAFIAVGALHLYGERGVLKLLAEQGYRVRRVY
jgi:uncharacterized protein